MSNTIAHRPHAHVDHTALYTVVLVSCTVLIAALVIWALNQPEQGVITTTGTEVAPAAAVVVTAVAPPESPVFRHALLRMYQNGGPDPQYVYGRQHQVDGVTLDHRTASSSVIVDRSKLPTPFANAMP